MAVDVFIKNVITYIIVAIGCGCMKNVITYIIVAVGCGCMKNVITYITVTIGCRCVMNVKTYIIVSCLVPSASGLCYTRCGNMASSGRECGRLPAGVLQDRHVLRARLRDDSHRIYHHAHRIPRLLRRHTGKPVHAGSGESARRVAGSRQTVDAAILFCCVIKKLEGRGGKGGGILCSFVFICFVVVCF